MLTPQSDLSDALVVTTAMSLGACSAKQILAELHVPVTLANEERVAAILVENNFHHHGSTWAEAW